MFRLSGSWLSFLQQELRSQSCQGLATLSKDHCDLGFEGMCRAIWIGCNAFDDGIVDGMMIMLMLMMTMLMTVVMM